MAYLRNPPDVLSDPTLASHRAQLLEYELIADLLKDAWFRRRQPMEVPRADVDFAGYDVVLECNGVLRHIQLKSTYTRSKTRHQKIHVALGLKPSGCVVWIVARAWRESQPVDLQLDYLVFGGQAGRPLPELDGFKVAKHSKANASGVKNERPDLRLVPKTEFFPTKDLCALSDWLFGPAPVP